VSALRAIIALKAEQIVFQLLKAGMRAITAIIAFNAFSALRPDEILSV
jgi:hypothetical protein